MNEYLMIVSLNDLQEKSGSVLHILSEKLKQITIIIIIYQNVQRLNLQNNKKYTNICMSKVILKVLNK